MNTIIQRKQVLQIHPKDNVLVALQNLAKGSLIFFEKNEYVLQDDIGAKQKFFIKDMHPADEVIMYGVLVGKAQVIIPKGGLMSTANVKHAAEPYAYRKSNYQWHAPDVSKFKDRTFNGYKRSNGKTGTANYWLFIPTVFCENRNMDVIREVLQGELGYSSTEKYKSFTRALIQAQQSGEKLKDTDALSFVVSDTRSRVFKNVDGIRFLNHDGGCGGIRQDSAVLGKLLAAYANHPNVGGITILSLGCQHLQSVELLENIKKTDPAFEKPVFVFEQQQSLSEEQLIQSA